MIESTKSEAAIFSRVIDRALSSFSPETAHSFIDLGFSEEDHVRVHELSKRNQDGSVSAEEKGELMNYVKVGNLLALLQSRVRKLLKEHSSH